MPNENLNTGSESQTGDTANAAEAGHKKRNRARIVFDPFELRYDFGGDHPFQSRRIVALVDLLESSGLWRSDEQGQCLAFRAATMEELSLIHTPDYLAAVQRLSEPQTTFTSLEAELERKRAGRSHLEAVYGFAEGDTPPFPQMHQVSALIAGGTLAALSAVVGLPEGGTFASPDERPLHVFHPAGGLHHAWANRASGFCVYNDIAVAIAHVLKSTEAKILYLDFDAHHGDGVQRAFYDDPRVMTVSFHETGHYLFPGTGDVLELGSGSGRGYSVNIPLEPFTEDASFIEAMNSVLVPLVMAFGPDVIVSQHGCDGHAWDPLTHLALTTSSYQAQARLTHELAHQYCEGRWVALGGGGYDQFRVVPRVWSAVWAEMSDQSLPEQLPGPWVERWQSEWQATAELEEAEQATMGKTSLATYFPTTFSDRAEDFPAQPRRWAIAEANRRTTALVRHLLLPSAVSRAFSSTVRTSPMSGIFDLFHLGGSEFPSRTKTIETARGPLLLRNFCPPSLVERLTPESDLDAFARAAEREHRLLISIAKNPDCALILAHTPEGVIVGQVTLAFGDEWWEGLENVYEVSIEVSRGWRGMGIAPRLLAFALELDTLEDMTLFAMGLSWHWDYEKMGLSPHRYREMIARLFATQGFVEQPTTEPDIRMEPSNIMLVRIGKNVNEFQTRRFYKRVLSSPAVTPW
ncbi:MAG TPA: GNAT family N-acetyltransferase [Ktedonobacteraceae bacterium]|nr:GNAT family N-acetyltransferase [Ktedonobacteraceae bacterium]